MFQLNHYHMNSRTKNELIKLCDAIATLAHGVVLTTGLQTTTEVMNQCEQTKLAIQADETIVEVR